MHNLSNSLLAAFSLALATAAAAQSNDFATGNMHFSAADMDTNGDHMISKDEFMQYEGKMWAMVSKGKDTVAVRDAASEFARGNMHVSARAMDTDHDGSISKTEFLSYGEGRFDKMKNKDGMMTVEDVTTNFARGNH